MSAFPDFKPYIGKDIQRFQDLFRQTLTHSNDLLGQALEMILQRQGKMMRPLLTLLTSRAFVDDAQDAPLDAVRTAVTIELLHTASLVHDDVVDESLERRGQKSLCAALGNKTAVLVGDYLLSLSLQMAAETAQGRIVAHIARLGGTLAKGEIAQLENTARQQTTEDDYFRVIQHKTAELFAACTQLAAVVQGTAEAVEMQARKFGLLTGLCFQIRDDLFDYDLTPAGEVGKPTGGADLREGKFTLPAIYALSQAPEEHEIRILAQRIRGREATDADIHRFIAFVHQAGGIDYARRRMEQLHQEASQCLAFSRSDEARGHLQRFLDYAVSRDF